MVNFSRHENEDKKLAVVMSPKSKSIKKSKVSNANIRISNNAEALKKSLLISLKPNELTTETNKNSYTNTSNQNSLTPTEQFQPFSNFSLYPSDIQLLFRRYPSFTNFDLRRTVYSMKVPNNTLSFRKKIEKFKLLSLGQETFVQNYLKDRYQSSLNPLLLKEYYSYLKCKIQVNNQIQEFFGKRFNVEQENKIPPLNSYKESYPDSYLCTPTTKFNDSLLPEDVMMQSCPKEFQVKYEDCDKYIEKDPFRSVFENEEEERFRFLNYF